MLKRKHRTGDAEQAEQRPTPDRRRDLRKRDEGADDEAARAQADEEHHGHRAEVVVELGELLRFDRYPEATWFRSSKTCCNCRGSSVAALCNRNSDFINSPSSRRVVALRHQLLGVRQHDLADRHVGVERSQHAFDRHRSHRIAYSRGIRILYFTARFKMSVKKVAAVDVFELRGQVGGENRVDVSAKGHQVGPRIRGADSVENARHRLRVFEAHRQHQRDQRVLRIADG